jgi:hypothetical protein
LLILLIAILLIAISQIAILLIVDNC